MDTFEKDQFCQDTIKFQSGVTMIDSAQSDFDDYESDTD